ncbi:hypothetical protein Pan258_17820 [Symmachiella dynata]|uniref:Sulfatase n=1 Tax=Symmachiella dynata TaxID=2527995 RepID=A0A517ZLH4_9PLAN|nr:DUF1501 domain-containing protein [Symmachiella dynata]QDT47746.1 hypothetical protein Pan258_17820 [Symmachiella dynata]QDU43341.1 hypothetical protein Mal52_18130 [Symmachiella dynata]
MLGFYTGNDQTCGGVSRREALRIGGISGLGLSLPNWLRQQALSDEASRPKDVNCIFLWLLGGPSQIETYDLKPHAPVEIRGEFQPIQTATPGLLVNELMPKLAQSSQLYSVIRSMTSTVTGHPLGHYYLNSGRQKLPGFTPAGFGAAVMQQQQSAADVPGFVQLGKTYRPDVGKGGYLGRKFDPIEIRQDPNRGPIDLSNFARPDAVDIDRFDGRQRLLTALDAYQEQVESQAAFGVTDSFYEKAFSILASPKTKQAFDLSQEPDKVRDAYGRNRVGQRMLLARRLIEAGSRFVRVQGYAFRGYDTHFNHWDTMRKELPVYDSAYSALLEDLQDRGMLENTLVVTVGEFGRTPVINKVRGGRDHWSNCFSLTLSGGGIKPGQLIGESDRTGAYPKSRRLTVPDFARTIYHALGLNPHDEFHTNDGRPIVALPQGEVVRELV